MPPVNEKQSMTTIDPDKRFVHTFRQSWVNTYMNCPELARLEMLHTYPRIDSDAALVGTAVHAMIEEVIDLKMIGVNLDVGDCVHLFQQIWERMQDEQQQWDDEAGEAFWVPRGPDNGIKWVSRTPAGAEAFGRQCAARWALHVLPTLEPYGTEISFGPYAIYEDDTRVIRIKGSVDYLDQNLGPVDWKTASRPYIAWEKKRWAIQPTMYVAGIAKAFVEGDLPDPYGLGYYTGDLASFTFVVMPDDRTTDPPQIITVERKSEWDMWLVDQLKTIAYQLEANWLGYLPEWPKRDQHALCSGKWCPAWGDCKGKLITLP